MRRREFVRLVVGAAAWPRAAYSQQTGRMARIGFLIAQEHDPDMRARISGLKQGLERLGWKDGGNIQIDYRFGDGKAARFEPLARELVALQPNLIIAQTPPVVAVMRREAGTIPIVFVDVSDAIGPGFVASLARPGGNLTGMISFEPGIIGKWLAMLKEIAPNITRVGLLGNPKTTAFDYFRQAAVQAAPSLKVELVFREVTTATDIENVIGGFAAAGNFGLIFPPDSTLALHRNLIIALPTRHRLPAVYPFPIFVEAGGLMSYSTDFVHNYRLTASYVDRILRGAKPADIPVQAPTKFQTVLNLKTANAMGLTVPPGLLVAADEVIE
jgi:putative ABC transport system substrate-binding protein